MRYRWYQRIALKKGVVKIASVLLVLFVIELLVIKVFNTKAFAAPWAPSMGAYSQRKQLEFTNTTGQTLESGTTYQITVDTKTLYDNGYLQSGCQDLRVIYQPNDATATELATYADPAGDTPDCSNSYSTSVYFPLQANIANNATTLSYYLYYGSHTATAPSNAADAFDINSKNAMLSCPFNGNTRCAAGETPSTATGALRYPGSKSGLLFDGVNDYLSAPDSASLSVTGNLTVETWVKFKQIDREQTLVAKWDETTANDDRSYRLYATAANKFAFSVSTNGASGTVTTITGTTTTVTSGKWYHVAGVYNASAQTINLYVNGTSDATQVGSVGTSLDDNASLLYIGAKENTGGTQDTYLSGLVEEVRISNQLRYQGTFSPNLAPFGNDAAAKAIYHLDETGKDPRITNAVFDASQNDNDATLNGPVYVSTFIGVDGPSVYGTHNASNDAIVLSDSTAAWSPNEWVGYTIYNSTDASAGIITSNTENTITATLAGGTENKWDTNDQYALNPDHGRTQSQATASHWGVFVEEATGNKITNPSFENTTYDTSWQEGEGTGVITAVYRTTAETDLGTQNITTSDLGGHTPEAAIVIATYTTTDGTGAANHRFSYGAATGASNEWYVTERQVDNIGGGAGTVTYSRSGSDALLNLDNTATNTNSTQAKAEFSAFITNGITINWTDAAEDAIHLTVIFFAGDALQAYAGSKDLADTAYVDNTDPTPDVGYVEFTEPGFQPDMIFTGLGYDTATPANQSAFGLVQYNGSVVTQQSLLHYFVNNAGTYGGMTRAINNGGVGQLTPVGNIDWYGSFHDFNSNGFTVRTNTNGANGTDLRYLALDFGTLSNWVGTHTTATSTGQANEIGPGFTPQLVFQIMNGTEAYNTLYSDSRAGSFGFSAFSSTAAYSAGMSSEDGVTTSNTQTINDDKAILFPDDDGTTLIAGDFDGMDTHDGWYIDYTTVTATGKKFLAAAISSLEFLNRSIETNDPFVRFGSRSAKLVATGGDTSLVTPVNPGNTNSHTMSVYVYRGTAGNSGGTVNNTVARILWEDVAQASTVYTDVGGGWWRLTYTAATTNTGNNYGVWLANGETIYIDGLQLEEKAYATTFSDGGLGTGYTWSGAIHSSASTRAAGSLKYATASNIQASAGTVSFWVKPLWEGDDGREHVFFDTDTSAGTLKLYKTTGDDLILYDGTNTATVDISAWDKDSWHHVVGTWDGSSFLDLYVDATAGTGSGAYSAPTLGTSIYVGQSKTNASLANSVIADLRIYDTGLTATEITDMYSVGLGSYVSLMPVDRFGGETPPVLSWNLNEGFGTIANDGSGQDNPGTITNATWSTDQTSIGGVKYTSLKFDGTGDYVSRTYTQDRDLDPGAESFTVGAWFRHSATLPSGNEFLVSRYNGAGYKIWMNTSGYICFGIDDDSSYGPDDSICGTTSYADNNWHHVEAVKTSTTTLTLFVDGRQDATGAIASATGSLNGTETPLYVGIDSSGGSGGWIGWINHVQYFANAHTLADAQTHYTGRGSVLGVSISFGDPGTNYALTRGLAGYWKLDETSGNAQDTSGNSNNLTDVNTVAFTSGKFGRAGDFESTSSEYQHAADSASLSQTGNITLSAWIQPESVTAATQFNIAGKWDDTNESYLLAQYGDEIRLYIDASANYVTTTASNLAAGTMYHVAGVYNNTTQTATIYINGTVQTTTTSGTIPASIGDDAGRFHIGAEDHSATAANFYDGKIDEVRLYSRALGLSEVQQLYGWAPGPVGYWDFNEGSGTTSNDKSGNGNIGTLSAGMTQDDWLPGKYGNALDFDGTNDFVSVGTGINKTHGTGTINFWMNSTNDTGRTVFYMGIGNLSGDRLVVYTGNGVTGGLTDEIVTIAKITNTSNPNWIVGYTTSNRAELFDGNWHYVSIVFHGGSTTYPSIYIDGVLKTTTSTDPGPPDYDYGFASADYAYIGASRVSGADNSFYLGKLDDFKIYDYVRTGTQIIEDMNAGHPPVGSPIASALVHYKFDEGYGTTANNSGNSPATTGSISGASWSNDGKIAKALNFDGSDDYVQITNSAIDGLRTITVSGWIYLDGYGENSNGRFFQKNLGFAFYPASPGYMIFEGRQWGDTYGQWQTASGTITTGRWIHVAATYDANSLANDPKIYINGVSFPVTENQTPVGDWFAETEDAYIGSEASTTRSFDGKIDEVKIYNYVLSDAQVRTDFNQGKSQVFGSTSTASSGTTTSQAAARDFCVPGDSSTCNAPVGEWTFDENSGTSSTQDTSDNSYTGTLTSITDTNWVPGKAGSALNLDGAADFVDVTSGPATVRSISFWVYPETTTEYFVNLTSTTDYIWANSGTVTATGMTSPTIYVNGTPSTTIVADQWQHITVTSSTSENASNLEFGRTQNANYLEGKIDQVRLYDYVRTPSQTAWEFNRGAPIGHWRFDECTGTTAYDTSGMGINGTIVPGASGNTAAGTCTSGSSTDMWYDGVDGKLNASLGFDGTNDYVTMGDPTSGLYDFANGRDFTVAGWFYFNNFDAVQTLFAKKTGNSAGVAGYMINIGVNAKPNFYVSDGDGVNQIWRSTLNTFLVNTWYHITVVYDDDDITKTHMYINGIADVGGTTGTLANIDDITNASPFVVGAEADFGFPLNGKIDDVRMYNYALSARQIRTLIQEGAVRFGPQTGMPQ